MRQSENFNLRIPKGTRDLLPSEKILKNKLVDVLKSNFEIFGFSPLETPALELLDVLTAKFAAGEKSDAMKELFTLRDRGNRELGLRFDMTVPLARVVASNPQIPKPFKRYAIGPAWRNGPVKTGRYREFWQCDVDTVGIKEMYADAEILSLVNKIFDKLGIKHEIRINNRKILTGILKDLEIPLEKHKEVVITIDKLHKLTKEELLEEFYNERGIDKKTAEKILEMIKIKDIKILEKKIKNGQDGLKELKELLKYCKMFNVKNLVFDVSLARGLTYYTSTVFEVFASDGLIKSSLAAGGRWDDMIQKFSKLDKKIPAVGISFGIDVILDYLKLSNKIELKKSVCDVLVIPLETVKESIEILTELREKNIKSDIELSNKSLSKKLKYVNTLEIPFVVIVGKKDLVNGQITFKEMKKGEERKVRRGSLIEELKNILFKK